MAGFDNSARWHEEIEICNFLWLPVVDDSNRGTFSRMLFGRFVVFIGVAMPTYSAFEFEPGISDFRSFFATTDTPGIRLIDPHNYMHFNELRIYLHAIFLINLRHWLCACDVLQQALAAELLIP